MRSIEESSLFQDLNLWSKISPNNRIWLLKWFFFLKFLHVNGRFFDLRIVIGVQSGIAGFSQLFFCISSVVRDLSRSKPVGNVHSVLGGRANPCGRRWMPTSKSWRLCLLKLLDNTFYLLWDSQPCPWKAMVWSWNFLLVGELLVAGSVDRYIYISLRIHVWYIYLHFP